MTITQPGEELVAEMDLFNNTTYLEPDQLTSDSEKAWYLAGTFMFRIESTVIAIVNTFAFTIIFKSEKCFGKNGFREQLLIMCVNDILSGTTFFCLTFCLEKDRVCQLELSYTFFVLFAFSQCTSFGNTLGVSLQRFLATRRAGDVKPGWTRGYTAGYCVLNIVVMACLFVLYFILNAYLSQSVSTVLLVITFSTIVLITDTLCCLTLYFLNKNMQTVSSGWRARITEQTSGPTEASTTISGTNNDPPRTTPSIEITGEKQRREYSNDKTSSTNMAKIEERIRNAHVVAASKKRSYTLTIPPVFKGIDSKATRRPPYSVQWAVPIQHLSMPLDIRGNTPQFLSRFGRYQRDAGLTVALVVLLLNVFTFVPVLVSIITRIIPDLDNLAAYRSVIMCFTLNSLINPFVYVFRMKSLEARIIKMLRGFVRSCFAR